MCWKYLNVLIAIAVISCLALNTECKGVTKQSNGGLEIQNTEISTKTKSSFTDTTEDYDDDDDDYEEEDDDEEDDEDYVDEHEEYEEEYHRKNAPKGQNKDINKKTAPAKASVAKTKKTVATNTKTVTDQTAAKTSISSDTVTTSSGKSKASKTASKTTTTKGAKKSTSKKNSPSNTETDESSISETVSVTNLKDVEFIKDANNAACSLKLNKDITVKNEPLFLEKDSKTDSFHFAIPNLVAKGKKYDKGIAAVQFNKEDSLYLSCPGKDNKLQNVNGGSKSESEIKCSAGTQVYAQTEQVPKVIESSNLVCLKAPEPTAIYNKDKKPCGDISGSDRGILVELGFSSEGWHKLIDVCYDAGKLRTLYATHTLYGAVLAGAVVDSNRPSFKKGQDEFYLGNPTDYYTKENQKKVVYDLTHDGRYLDPKNLYFLAKGHFAPDADFLFKSWQDATYFFVNAAPQWQCINQGHWLSVERSARNIAMKLGENLDVSTGPYGIMELPNTEGKMVPFYLTYPQKNSGKKAKKEVTYLELAVPSFYWKIIHRPKTNECIVLVSTNNPYTKNPDEFKCKSVCEQYNWPKLWDQKKGYVKCCRYQEFKNVVTYAPEYNCEGGILVGP